MICSPGRKGERLVPAMVQKDGARRKGRYRSSARDQEKVAAMTPCCGSTMKWEGGDLSLPEEEQYPKGGKLATLLDY